MPIAGRVSSVEKLPETAADGTIYEVQGSAASPYSSFYVVRNGDVWDETVKPGLRNAIDEATMPHCLIREADGTFTFAPFSWAPRRVGDEATNPMPTFVGRSLRDVFFYQNRLAFLVDENVILSGAGDFGNFWRNTVLDVIDSDVVDVAVTSSQVSILEHAILFNDGALLIADQTQFSLSNGEDGVTPASMSILPVTHYTVNKAARPVTMGTEVYFCGNVSGQSTVYEYSRLQDTEATTAADITAHVPGLIPGDVQELCAGPRALFAFMGDTRAFCYQLYWNGNEKLMSAWRPWTFHGEVKAAETLDDQLYQVVAYDDGLFLEKIDLSDGAKPASQPNQVYLDRRVEIVGTYDEAEDRTTFVLPYEVQEEDRPLVDVIYGNSASVPHQRVNTELIEWDSPTTLSVPHNVAGETCIGLRYSFHVELSQQFPVDYQGRPLTSGRLQMRTLSVRYTNSGRFDVEVYPYGHAPRDDLEADFPKRVATFVGRKLGTASAILGAPAYTTGSFRVALAGDSRKVVIRLTNDSHMASTFSSAEWEGLYHSRVMG